MLRNLSLQEESAENFKNYKNDGRDCDGISWFLLFLCEQGIFVYWFFVRVGDCGMGWNGHQNAQKGCSLGFGCESG